MQRAAKACSPSEELKHRYWYNVTSLMPLFFLFCPVTLPKLILARSQTMRFCKIMTETGTLQVHTQLLWPQKDWQIEKWHIARTYFMAKL